MRLPVFSTERTPWAGIGAEASIISEAPGHLEVTGWIQLGRRLVSVWWLIGARKRPGEV